MKNHSYGVLLKNILVFFILTCGLLSLNAGEIIISQEKGGIQFTGASYQKLEFTIHISNVQFRDVQSAVGPFTELYIDGFGFSNRVGDPKLPVYRKLIESPLNASFHITYGKTEYVDYDLASLGIMYRLIPAQAPLSKNITDPADIPFIYNTAAYQRNEFSGEPLVSVTPDGIMRSVNLANLAVSPFLYNPVTNILRIYTKVEATVTFENADITSTIELKKKTYSPFFGKVYNLLPNYQQITDELITSGPVTYVIVAPRNYEDSLQRFVEWKTKKGFKVIEAYTDDPLVGNTKTSIKSYLTGLYNDPPAGYDPPSFILFAGDVGQVPTHNVSGHPTDLYYCEYTNDKIPEAYYGRFAANNLTQLKAYIDKTLEYEQYTMPVDTFLNEVVMIAGEDATFGTLYGNGQINYGTSQYFNQAHNLISHTYLQPEPGGANYSQQIRNNVSNGVSYVNYTAHGSEQGWSNPPFTITQIPALQNSNKYPLMVGNCCKTSNFAVNCFAKEITRVSNKGALGYIGCSDYSYWDEDFWWACGFKNVSVFPPYNANHLGAYDVTFHDHGEPIEKWYVTMGQMIVGGNMAVHESSSSMKTYYWETYCLMGDPSLSIYYSVPQLITASYPEEMPTGVDTIIVNTEPYAYVSLSVHDTTLLDAKCADSTGVVVLAFNSVNEVCDINIVISKQNRKPLIDSIPVVPFILSISASPDTLCRGESSQLLVSVAGGTGNFTYLWAPSDFLNDPAVPNPVAIAETSIEYTVTVDDGTYVVTSSPVTLTVIPSPETPLITLEEDTLVSDALAGNQWYRYQEMIPGATEPKYVPLISGDYSVKVTDTATGCSSLMSNIIPYYFTGIKGFRGDRNISVYPNPVRDNFTVSYTLPEAGPVMVSLFDAVGKEIKILENIIRQNSGQHLIFMEGNSLDKGMYYIKIRTETYSTSIKIIVTK